MKYSIPSLDSSLFDWLTWRRRCISEIWDLPFRYKFLVSDYGKIKMRIYAVGWCEGSDLLCRPKTDHVGLMCWKDGEEFWFHLRREEFDKIFGE